MLDYSRPSRLKIIIENEIRANHALFGLPFWWSWQCSDSCAILVVTLISRCFDVTLPKLIDKLE